MHPQTFEVLDLVQTFLLQRLATCAPRDMAAAAQHAAVLDPLATPGNNLRRLGLRLNYGLPNEAARAERAVAARAATGAPMLQLHLPGLHQQPFDDDDPRIWLAKQLSARTAWEESVFTLCGRALAVCKPLYIEVTAVGDDLDLLQVEALARLFATSNTAPPRALLRAVFRLELLTPDGAADLSDAGVAAAYAALGYPEDPALPVRLLRLLENRALAYTQLNLRLCAATLPGLTACVTRGGIARKLVIDNVDQELQVAQCDDWFAAMAAPETTPPWLDMCAADDGGGDDTQGVMLGTEAVAFIPPAAACARFSCYMLPRGAEAALAGWPALRDARFEYWNFSDDAEHAWDSLPRTLERLSLCFDFGIFTSDWLSTAERLLRDTEHLPALKAVFLEGADQLGENDRAWDEPPETRAADRALSRVRKFVYLQGSREVIAFLSRRNKLGPWRRRLAENQIGLRLPDVRFVLRRGSSN